MDLWWLVNWQKRVRAHSILIILEVVLSIDSYVVVVVVVVVILVLVADISVLSEREEEKCLRHNAELCLHLRKCSLL